MKRNVTMRILIGALILVLLASTAVAQGRGQGRGMGNGRCRGIGMGGPWIRYASQTPEQKTFVANKTDLRNRICAANRELTLLRAQNAPPAAIAGKQQTVTNLRAELQKVTAANSGLRQQTGVPAGRGVCDGTGPKGKGSCANCPNPGLNCANCPNYGVNCPGCSPGRGQGCGMRLRDGNGPNPNCPYKK